VIRRFTSRPNNIVVSIRMFVFCVGLPTFPPSLFFHRTFLTRAATCTWALVWTPSFWDCVIFTLAGAARTVITPRSGRVAADFSCATVECGRQTRREINLHWHIPLPARYDAVCAATSGRSRLWAISSGFVSWLGLDGIRRVVRGNRRIFVSVTPIIHLAEGNVIMHERLHTVGNLNAVVFLFRRVFWDGRDGPS
jgi:hypothetical protein